MQEESTIRPGTELAPGVQLEGDGSLTAENGTVTGAKKDKDYYFDKPELKATIPGGEGKSLTLFYTKPADDDHIDYESMVQRRAVIDDSGSEDDSDAEEANVEFFDRLAVRAEKTRDGSKGDPLKTYTREECLKWEPETKTAFVKAMGATTFKVLVDDDDEDAWMVCGTEPIKVEQIIGDEANPDYRIVYTMMPTPKAQRKDFIDGIKQKDKNQKKKVVRTSKYSLIRKGMKIFASNFRSVEGGRLERGVYSEDLRDDFLSQIDKAVQMLVIDTIVAFYGGPPKS